MKIIYNAFFANLCYMLMSGFVFSKLWQWFIVPLGLSPITWIHGTAIYLIASFLTFPIRYKLAEMNKNTDLKSSDIFARIGAFGLYCGVILLYGVVIKQFI